MQKRENTTPEIRGKRAPRKAVIVLLAAVCVVLAALLVLQTMRLQREQERYAAAEMTVDEARELLELADADLEGYCDTARKYYSEKNHPFAEGMKPQDYSEIFAGYQQRHPIPGALIGGDNTR